MAKQTSSLVVSPWLGGLNSTDDPAFLSPGVMQQADNIVFDFDSSKKRREGINYDWDDATPSANKVVGGIDYWVGTSDSKAQYLISVLSNGTVYRTEAGVRTLIADAGTPWAIPANGLTEANLEVFNNRVIIAVSGISNQMKYWDGNPSNPLRDLPSIVYNAGIPIVSVSRSSAGTTRTLIFNLPVTIANGQRIVINDGPAGYVGSYILASGGGTTTVTYVASSPLTESTTPDVTLSIGTFAPLALYIREHQGRLLTNDKTRLDYLMFSEINDHRVWGGSGTSGGFAIGQGDGDPAGITGISPTYRGDVFVGKRTKLYRIPQSADFDFAAVIKISNGIGFLSHQGIVPIDQDDIFFVSDRGLHSLQATNAYGDFSANYISRDIQKSFVYNWEQSRKPFIKGVYLPDINSAMFSVSESGSATNNSMYLYNLQLKYWYRWPGVSAESLISAQDPDRRRAYLGTTDGRLAQSLTGANQDTNTLGGLSPIIEKLKTGILWCDSRSDTIKAFKRISIMYRGSGSFQIIATVQIDNFAPQAVSFFSSSLALPLGTMVLGQDVLGGSYEFAPYSQPIDGYGRGITLTIEQSDLNTGLAIQGFVVEFESAGDSPETRQDNN